jgi:dipeptidyl aminopeptidase/acylaminoacyl peptidase
MARIFISYSRIHEPFARRLATALSDSGAEVWIDVEDIPAGMNWSRAIQSGLDQCDMMLVIITPESMSSHNVENEWQYYLDEKKPVIPIKLQDAKTHFQLRRLQHIDFDKLPFETAFAQLVREMRRLGYVLTLPPEMAAYEALAQPAPPPVPLTPTPPPLYMPPESGNLSGGISKEISKNVSMPQPAPLRKSVRISPVMIAGVLAALGLGALVTLFSMSNLMSSSSNAATTGVATTDATGVAGTETAAVAGTLQAAVVGSAVAGTPTFNAAVVGTWTAEAALAFVPTPTPIPPSDTPLPTDTPTPEPTAEVMVEATATEALDFSSIGYNPDVVDFQARPLVLFVSERDGDSDLYLFDTGSDQIAPITVNDCNDYKPAWQPNGEGIVYVSDCTGTEELFIIYALGLAPSPLTFNTAEEAYPAWLNDERIYFLSDQARTGDFELFSLPSSGTEMLEQSHSDHPVASFGSGFAFSPDGVQLAYPIILDDGRAYLQLRDGDTGDTRLIENDPAHIEYFPAWSPDGRFIAYVQLRADTQEYKLNIYGTTTGETRTLAQSSIFMGNLSWHPYDSVLALPWHPADASVGGLYFLNIETGEYELQFEDPFIRNVAWRPGL